MMFKWTFLLVLLANGYGFISKNISIPVACTPPNNTFPFCNTSLSSRERINNLISLLTLTEKANLLTARQSPAITRLGIPAYNWGTNCIHSVLSACDGVHCPTVYPQPNGLGATFNASLIYNISVVIGLELRALWLQGVIGGLDCWGPTINIGRDPRWGRMYEVVSEDPYWNGLYGTLFTLGLQNSSISTGYSDSNYYLGVATLKHFAAYSLGGYQSFTFNAIVSDYMFADTYFPPFIAAIKHGNAAGVMCSYNSINGVPACVDNDLLKATLRQKFQFNGYITSDSSAIAQACNGHHYTNTQIDATQLALQASVDIDSGSLYSKYIPTLVTNGDISVDLVNKALFDSFNIRFGLGLFDQPVAQQTYFNIPTDIVNSKQHQELNLLATYQVMTLLKNKNNQILPFDLHNKDLIYGVIGPHYNASVVFTQQYTGQVCIDRTNDCILSVLNAMKMYVDDANILYSQGCNGVICNSTVGFANATAIANKSDIIILLMGLNAQIETEGIDRTNISLPGYQQLLASQICDLGKPTVLVLVNGGIIGIDELKYKCPAILEIWYPGFRGSQGLVDTLFGINNPGGKMPVTMYWSNFTSMADWHGMDLTAAPFGRTYKYWTGPKPLYPFAWGLSYTQFKFQFYNHTTANDCNQSNFEFCVQITNVGNCSGHETIFVFVEMPQSKSISNDEPASKMIKRLAEFQKMYLPIGHNYVFKWRLNQTDLMMYNSKGINTLFAGNYTLSFTNGVDQYLTFDIQIKDKSGDKQKFWSTENIIIVAICSVIGLAIIVLGLYWCLKRRNYNQTQHELRNKLNNVQNN